MIQSVAADQLHGRTLFELQLQDTAVIAMFDRVIYRSLTYDVLGVKAPVTDQFILLALVALVE